MADQAELAQEQKRVDDVIRQINVQIGHTKESLAAAHKETRAVEKNYSENASINRYEVDDIAESRSAIEQQRQLVSRAAENEDILRRQLHTLEILKKSPYFGRIDIKDPGEDEQESLYIGVASLMNDDRTDFLVYDWRAPISGIYYNGTLGTVSYQTPSGLRQTQLLKKRQFTIVDGKITNMFDTNETVGDEMLQSALGHTDDQYMQNIVATIQHEQNDIIRNTDSDLMIVQGVAGSGKTSTILQRIAYLLYHAKASLNADQIVLFSPNRLFSQYISQVLPSLGERNMRQVTLDGFLKRRFEGLNVESIFDRYEKVGMDGGPTQAVMESPAFMQAVIDYCQQVQDGQYELFFRDITFRQQTFFSAQHVADIFARQPAAMSIPDRLVRTKNRLIRELQARTRTEANKDWLQKELNDLTRLQISRLMGKHHLDDFKDEQAMNRYLARRLAHERLRIVADAIYNNYFLNFNAQYQNFLGNNHGWGKQIDDELIAALIKDFQHDWEYHRLKLVHAAPLMLLRDLITGEGQNHDFQYVFIDEMQDYSPAMLMYFRHVFANAKFTILGDSEQALFYPLSLPEALLQRLSRELHAKHPRLITLRQSYRSTYEITSFAKSLLPDGDLIHAFNRHGEKPSLTMSYHHDQWEKDLIQAVNQGLAQYPTVAILTRTEQQAQSIYSLIHRYFDNIHCLNAHNKQMPDGVLVLPAYLAKGLEFDSVIIANSSAQALGEKATGLLYTMASRAMHQLSILSLGPVSDVFTDKACRHLKITHQLN